MVIIKPTKSGKGVLVQDDFGNVYVTSKKYLLAVLAGTMKSPLVLMTRMPQPSKPDRYNSSPILGQDGEHIEPDDDRWTQPQCLHSVEAASWGEDGMDRKQTKKREKKKQYTDKVINF